MKYPNLEKTKLIHQELNPVGLVYFIRRKEDNKNIVDKNVVEFNKYGKEDIHREKLLTEISNRDDFICWAAECEQVPFTDEQMQELSSYKEIGLAILLNTKLKLPDHLI